MKSSVFVVTTNFAFILLSLIHKLTACANLLFCLLLNWVIRLQALTHDGEVKKMTSAHESNLKTFNWISKFSMARCLLSTIKAFLILAHVHLHHWYIGCCYCCRFQWNWKQRSCCMKQNKKYLAKNVQVEFSFSWTFH